MNLTRCAKGHYYDMDKFSMCPHCASANEGMGQTMRYTQPVNDSAFSGGTSLSSNATDDTVNYTDADTSLWKYHQSDSQVAGSSAERRKRQSEF